MNRGNCLPRGKCTRYRPEVPKQHTRVLFKRNAEKNSESKVLENFGCGFSRMCLNTCGVFKSKALSPSTRYLLPVLTKCEQLVYTEPAGCKLSL